MGWILGGRLPGLLPVCACDLEEQAGRQGSLSVSSSGFSCLSASNWIKTNWIQSPNGKFGVPGCMHQKAGPLEPKSSSSPAAGKNSGQPRMEDHAAACQCWGTRKKRRREQRKRDPKGNQRPDRPNISCPCLASFFCFVCSSSLSPNPDARK